MAAPAVRDLQSLIQQQNAALTPQYDLINSDIKSNAEAGKAQELGLTAKKDQAFGQIEQTASDKGMFFSGFSPSEQAGYTAGTYLPALAQLQQTIAQTRSNLLGKKAELGKGAFDTAVNLQEGDIGRKFTYDERVAGQQFSADQAERQRQFDARENAATRAASAAQSAAARSAEPSAAQNLAAALTAKAGGDGYVSPGTWQALKSQWVSGGYGSAASFDSSFATYRNPDNKYYKLGG